MILCITGGRWRRGVACREHEVGLVIPSLLSEEMQFDVYLVAHSRDAIQTFHLVFE